MARAVLARFGEPHDLDRLWQDYPSAGDDVARSEIVSGIYRMEVAQRNAHLRAAETDGRLQKWASEAIRDGRTDPEDRPVRGRR